MAQVFKPNRISVSRTPAASAIEGLARQLAENIIKERESARRRARNGRIYTPFDPTDDV